jgi:hypothetical protein
MGRGQELRRQGRADRAVSLDASIEGRRRQDVGTDIALDREGCPVAPDLDRIFLAVVVGLCREPLERVAAPEFLRAVRIAVGSDAESSKNTVDVDVSGDKKRSDTGIVS